MADPLSGTLPVSTSMKVVFPLPEGPGLGVGAEAKSPLVSPKEQNLGVGVEHIPFNANFENKSLTVAAHLPTPSKHPKVPKRKNNPGFHSVTPRRA